MKLSKSEKASFLWFLFQTPVLSSRLDFPQWWSVIYETNTFFSQVAFDQCFTNAIEDKNNTIPYV